MVGTHPVGRDGESWSARVDFAVKLGELFEAAGNPTLHNVVRSTAERTRAARAAGSKEVVSPQRISDWRAGRAVPARFESFEQVVMTLISLAAQASKRSSGELLDRAAWLRLWRAARAQTGTPTRGARPVTLDPNRRRSRSASGNGGSRPPLTAVLRRDVAVLVGRDGDLRRLTEPGISAAIFAVDGMPGVGKTALVTRAAHRLRSRYPDGCFFVELNAHAAGLAPADPSEVLGTLLNDVGVDPQHVPDTLEGRRDLWRGWLCDRRVLLVLDDARDEDQIEPLLPPGSESLTLISSRRRMIAFDGAVAVSLDVLTPESACDLFCVLAGRTSEVTDVGAVGEIVRLCGYLPLAIVLVAGRLAHHPTWSIGDLAADLATAVDRLAELEAGPRAVRAAFTTSYVDLSVDRKRLVRRLGLVLGPNFDAYAVAAVTEISVAAARTELDALYADHLIDEIAAGRYRLHDLLREYLRTLADDDPLDEQDRARNGLLEYYRHTTATANRYQSRPTAYPVVPPRMDPGIIVREFGDQTQAAAWMRVERPNLLTCLDYAERRDPAWFIDMVAAMAAWMEREGPWPLAMGLHLRVVEAARNLGNRTGEATALVNLGYVRCLIGDYGTAIDSYQNALELFREVGDRTGEATALVNLGVARWRTADYDISSELFSQALACYRQLGDRFHEGVTLTNLAIARWLADDRDTGVDLLRQSLRIRREIGSAAGDMTGLTLVGLARMLTGNYTQLAGLFEEVLQVHRETGSFAGEVSSLTNLGFLKCRLGEYPQAIDLLGQALSRHREIGSRVGEALVLINLGIVHRRIGNHPAAAELCHDALALCHDIGDREGEATARTCLGVIHRDTEQYTVAADLFQESLTCFRELGNRHGETETLNEIGQLLTTTSRVDEALTVFTEALTLARAIGSQFEQARALEGIARSHAILGDTAIAAARLREAIKIYRDHDVPEADAAAAYLETMLVRRI